MVEPEFTAWIIDDDSLFGRSLLRFLRAKGIPAEHFRSAQSFLDSIPPGRTGCALVDIRMPVVDGFELLSRMQSLHYTTPVILMTGHADGDPALPNGAFGFLRKPFSGESLLDLLRLLGMSGEQKT